MSDVLVRTTRRRLIITALGALGPVPSLLRAQEPALPNPVRLAIGEWPPYFSAGLRHHGVFAHIVAEAFRREGLAVDYQFYPWKRALAMAENGEAHGSPGWVHTEERARKLLYTDPVIVSREVVFFLRARPLSFQSVADLHGKLLGAAIGYHYGDAIEQAEKAGQVRLDRAASDEASLRKLLAGRLDGVLLNREVGLDLLLQKFSADELAAVGHSERALVEKPSHMVVGKVLPEGPALVRAFNQGLGKLQREGVVRRLLDDMARGAYLPRR